MRNRLYCGLLALLLISPSALANKNRDLLDATIAMDHGRIEQLLANNAKPSYRSNKHGSVLEAAICNNDMHALQLFKDAGWNVDDEATFYGAALVTSAYMVKPDVTNWLLDNGANVNVTDVNSTGWHVLDLAIHNLKFKNVPRCGRYHKVTDNSRLSDLEIEELNLEIVKRLLSEKPDIESIISGKKEFWISTYKSARKQNGEQIFKLQQQENDDRFSDYTIYHLLIEVDQVDLLKAAQKIGYPLPGEVGQFYLLRDSGSSLELAQWVVDQDINLNLSRSDIKADEISPGFAVTEHLYASKLSADVSPQYAKHYENRLNVIKLFMTSGFDMHKADIAGNTAYSLLVDLDSQAAEDLKKIHEEVQNNKRQARENHRDSLLPPEVRYDKYMVSLAEALKTDNYKKALPLFEKLYGLNMPLEQDIEFFYGETLLRTGSPQQAINQLYLYLAEAGKGGAYYVQALELINEAEKQL